MSQNYSEMLGDDHVVITGIAGRFPNSGNVSEFQEKLMKNEDCTADECRWNSEFETIPNRVGKIPGIEKFDCIFFGANIKLTEVMDPMTRIMMEVAYESIVDAGINPLTLKGSKTGVFMGSSFSDSEKSVFYEKIQLTGYGLMGCSRAMLPNRVSFSLGLTGPSINIDAACCSSGCALAEAFRAIKTGACDAAVVGGTYLCFHPHLSLHFLHLGLSSPDGVHKCFDEKADGYTRSESITAIFLQKASHAKRIYCEVANAMAEHVPSDVINSVMYPSAEGQVNIMEQTLTEAGVAPTDVTFVEADGSGIKFADAEEAKAIDQVYNKGRKSPLLIGSVKSNIGHTSPANTVNSVVKVITAMEKGVIPANLHYKSPPQDVESLVKGRLQVVTQNTPWEGNYASVNTSSFSGDFSHILLKAFHKEKKNGGLPDNLMPRLVCVSGRTEEAVATILDYLSSKEMDVEFLQLLYDVFEKKTMSHLYRGYIMLPPQSSSNAKKMQEIKHVTGEKKEIWYVFSGMGSQWAGMGGNLMQIPVFAEAMKKCDAVLKPYGLDIVQILTENDPKIYDNIVNCFVGIAAVQIGLVDVLQYVGLEPDMIIGHSVGELGCAYADGCFTAEEMILSALSRGLASKETQLPKGSMAAVGLGYHGVKPMCPPDIDVACHNGPDSATISGPADSMKKFVADLQAKGVFAREVPCSNIAYHSRYIAPAGPKLMEYLKKVITNPKPRSKRWVSTSVPRAEWNTLKARLSSAEYHTNNLLSPVLFDETSRLIPSNAIAIEIAPHGLLQAILKKSLPEKCINVPLTRRGNFENAEMLFAALGKLYNNDVQINPGKLYPRIPYPVGRGTASVSSLIRWDHASDWYVSLDRKKDFIVEGEKRFEIDLTRSEHIFLENHKIHGSIVLPFTLYLTLAWGILQSLQKDKDIVSVVFENLHTHEKIVPISKNDVVRLTVMVQKGSGRFEVTHDSEFLASGNIRVEPTPKDEFLNVGELVDVINDGLTEKDIYSELSFRGFEYDGDFRSIAKSSLNANNGMVRWNSNWITFLDGLLQMYILGNDTRKPQVPISIRKIVIDLKNHEISVKKSEVPVHINRQINVITTPFVEIQGIRLMTVDSDLTKEVVTLETATEVPLKQFSSPTWIAHQIYNGNPNSISWMTGPTLQSNKDVVKVQHATINQHDLLVAQGKSISNCGEGHELLNVKTFGLEFSGKNAKNEQVMGICTNGTLTSHLYPDAEYTWPIPAIWTSEEAVTVPLSYAVAYAALFLKGKIRKTHKLLVHDGSSEFGQAIINIALDEGCVVYTTYNTENEKKFLRSRYPRIPEHRICEYGGCCFRDKVLMDTKGQGVDIVITESNNMKEIEASLSCTRHHAQVIVIGDLEASVHDYVGMEIFLSEISLYSVIPMKIANADTDVKRVLSRLIRDGIESGTIKPLSRKVYGMQSLYEAFADGIAKTVTDKIVIHVQPETPRRALDNVPKFYCSESKSYLIVRNQSDFHLELADWLIVRGAKKIFLASEGQKSRYEEFRSTIWKKYGAAVITRDNVDLSRKQNVRVILEEAMGMGQIDGIFDLRKDQTSGQDPLAITKLLDEESRVVCQNLRFFVVCVPATNADKVWQSVVSKEKPTEELMKKRMTDRLAGLLLVCSSDNQGIKASCLTKFDEALMSHVSLAAIICREIAIKDNYKTLKHQREETNHSAGTEEYEGVDFMTGLPQKNKHISDKFEFFK